MTPHHEAPRSTPEPLQEVRAHLEHEARRARDWLLRESPLAHTRFGRDVRARAMALERARLARLPVSTRGLELSAEAIATMLRGHPPIPSDAKLAPSPATQAPVLGHFRSFSEGPDRLRLLLSLRETYGDVVRLRFGAMTAHLVSDPELVQEVLHSRNREFGKETRGMHKLRLVLGLGLLTSEGSFWLRQRRIAQPAFHRKRIAGFAERMVDASEDMVASWEDGQTFDAHHEMMKVTLRIVGETLLGTDVTGDADRIGAAVTHVVEDVNSRVNKLVDLGPPFPSRKNLAFERAMDTLDAVVLDMIAERRRSGVTGDDLLGMFMEVADEETGERMTDAQLRDEVMTIFLAGHETTANALSWAVYLLGTAPDVWRKLTAEVDAVLEGGRRATPADFPRLQYTRQVLEETMRLYPPAWMIARAPLADTTLGGYHMPAGSLIFLSPWVVHRHPDHWQSPEGFDPDRFAPGAEAGRHRYAYFPFGGGPRQCIGNNFALMEATLILATMVRDYRLDLVPGFPIELDPQITLRPKHGVRVVATKRR
ncbi:MAG: cytochrome P450 [Sandaracinus sp.]|nr:cytochrome P450 [Sandaracinus sp.]MCB9633104.1 cytochrome P450 [Sandaracinus sp.]